MQADAAQTLAGWVEFKQKKHGQLQPCTSYFFSLLIAELSKAFPSHIDLCAGMYLLTNRQRWDERRHAVVGEGSVFKAQSLFSNLHLHPSLQQQRQVASDQHCCWDYCVKVISLLPYLLGYKLNQ